jgi:hypothetical protein
MTLAADSEGCPGSNSVFVSGSGTALEQCVPVDDFRTYGFGGRFKGSAPPCAIWFYFFDGPNCTGNVVSFPDGWDHWALDLPATSQWLPSSGSFHPPTGARSAQIASQLMSTYVDQLWVTSNADGF